MRSWQFGALVVLIVVTASAFSQTAAYTVPAASVEVDFSFYHQTLSNAADVALANATRENEIGGQIAGVATNDMTQPDATRVYQPNKLLVANLWPQLVINRHSTH